MVTLECVQLMWDHLTLLVQRGLQGALVTLVSQLILYEHELINLEAALRSLTQEANLIGEKANAIHVKIRNNFVQPKEEHPPASTQR